MSAIMDSPDAAAFESFAADVRVRVERHLDGLFVRKLGQLNELGADAAAFGGVIRDFTMRSGKRLRAVLVAAGFVAARPDADLAPAITAGAAFELLQSYFLMHDDWMDGDTTRRGGPTAHVALARRFGSKQIGDSAAILAGDYAMAMAQEVLATLAVEPALVLEAIKRFVEVQLDTICGQLLDITDCDRAAGDFRLETLKTGSYSVCGPLVIGATLAGADARLIEACVAYARPLGIAFQLRDDLLGLFGDVKVTGKPAGNDIRAGKMTLVMRDALATVGPNARRALQSALGKPEATSDQISEAARIVAQSGAVERAEAQIRELAAAALRHIDASAGFSRPAIGFLALLAERLVARAV
jgi:geranylgeranyl diphosphate synthase type I